MGSAKQQTAITSVMSLLHEWDKGSKTVRRQILLDFIRQNANKTGPELEADFAQAASLFLTRLTAWLRLTYPYDDLISGVCHILYIMHDDSFNDIWKFCLIASMMWLFHYGLCYENWQ